MGLPERQSTGQPRTACGSGSGSEYILDSELHLSRSRVSGTRNAAKRRRAEISIRRLKACRIRDVVTLDADEQALFLCQMHTLAEGDIQTPLGRSVHGAGADVARSVLGLERKCRSVEPLLDRLRTRIGITIRVGAIAAAEVGYHGETCQQGVLRIVGSSRLHRSWPYRRQVDVLIQRHALGTMADVSRGYHEAAQLFLKNTVELVSPGYLVGCNRLLQHSGWIHSIIKHQGGEDVG